MAKLTKVCLQQKYWDEEWSCCDIGQLVGLTEGAIRYWMKKHNLPRRSNRKPTGRTRKKMSENHWDCAGQNHPFHGKTHTEDTRKKISDANKAKQPHCVISFTI